jgi:hypothetical protein
VGVPGQAHPRIPRLSQPTDGAGRAQPRRQDHPVRQRPPSREHRRRRPRPGCARLPQRLDLPGRVGRLGGRPATPWMATPSTPAAPAPVPTGTAQMGESCKATVPTATTAGPGPAGHQPTEDRRQPLASPGLVGCSGGGAAYRGSARVRVDAAGSGAVSHAGAVLLVETVRRLGLDQQVGRALARWRKPIAVHDPGKVVCYLGAVSPARMILWRSRLPARTYRSRLQWWKPCCRRASARRGWCRPRTGVYPTR